MHYNVMPLKGEKVHLFCNLLTIVIIITLCSVTLLTVEHLKDTYPIQIEWGDSTALKISE